MLRVSSCLLVHALVVLTNAGPARAEAPVAWPAVTDTSLVSAFAPLAEAHAARGLAAAVLSMQSAIAPHPEGRDDAERLRFFLRDATAVRGVRIVLLGGDEPLIPVRRIHTLQLPRSGVGDVGLPTDPYFACLAGD